MNQCIITGKQDAINIALPIKMVLESGEETFLHEGETESLQVSFPLSVKLIPFVQRGFIYAQKVNGEIGVMFEDNVKISSLEIEEVEEIINFLWIKGKNEGLNKEEVLNLDFSIAVVESKEMEEK